MLIRTTVLTLALFALAVPAADAHLPLKGGKSIVPGKSIGGVKLGMDATVAVQKWGGKGSTCEAAVSTSCLWAGTMRQGSLRFDVTNGKVSTIVITAGQKPQTFEPVYKGPITRWRTSKNVGIGTLMRTVGKRYPKAFPDGGGLQLRSGKIATYFESSLGRAASITIAPAA